MSKLNYETLRQDFNVHGMTYIDNFLDKADFIKISNLWNHTRYFEAKKQEDKSAYGNEFRHTIVKHFSNGAEGYVTDFNWPDKNETYKCNFSESEVVPKMKDVTTLVKNLIQPIAESIMSKHLKASQIHANIYKKNGDNFSRAHSDGSSFYTPIGFIYYVNKVQWKYDWGGLLHYLNPVDNGVDTILPISNRVVFINHGYDLKHWITPVCTWAREDRKTLTGMFEEKGQWEYYDEQGNVL